MSGKNKNKAQQTKSTVSSSLSPVDASPLPCMHKHWFGIRVKDELGNEVIDVQPSILLTSGDEIVPGLGVNGEYRTGLILENAGVCKVRFPDLSDCEWWPAGSAAPPPTEAGNSMTAVAGDCVVSLAVKNGYRDYHSIWDASQNDVLKSTRPNPNCLAAGDVIVGPALKQKVVNKPTDAFAEFIIRAKRAPKVKIVLVDKDLKPLDGWAWQLTAPSAASGTTSADGLIEFDNVDATKTRGSLTVTVKRKPAAPQPPPKPAVGPPPYPPPIVSAQFIDKEPVLAPDADTMVWTINLGSLPPAKEKSGVKARLHDLGYNCDLDSDDPKTALAIKTFQKAVLKKPATGAYADMQLDLDTKFSKA